MDLSFGCFGRGMVGDIFLVEEGGFPVREVGSMSTTMMLARCHMS